MLYNSGPSVEDGSSIRGGQGNIAGTTGLVLPTTTSDANCSGGGSSFYPASYSSSLGGTTSQSHGLGSAASASSSASNRAQLGQYCQPGTHQQHYPGQGQGPLSQGYQPQPHVTVSYAGAYNPSSVGVGGGVVGSAGKGPLHPAQNPHWTHRHGHHHHPSSTASSAKQHHSWMANYHGFVTPLRWVSYSLTFVDQTWFVDGKRSAQNYRALNGFHDIPDFSTDFLRQKYLENGGSSVDACFNVYRCAKDIKFGNLHLRYAPIRFP